MASDRKGHRARTFPAAGLEASLWVVGALALGSGARALLQAHLYQSAQRAALQRSLSLPATAPRASPRLDPAVLGTLDIPRIGLDAVVREGASAQTLRVAVGHIPGTAWPGQPGNICLAGHRDSFFRRLRSLRSGDVLRLSTRSGTFVYRVEKRQIVAPGDVAVLAPTAAPMLTLVTCYPFSFIGPAPRRFVVTARQVTVPSHTTTGRAGA